jgi:hypothetical protein
MKGRRSIAKGWLIFKAETETELKLGPILQLLAGEGRVFSLGVAQIH